MLDQLGRAQKSHCALAVVRRPAIYLFGAEHLLRRIRSNHASSRYRRSVPSRQDPVKALPAEDEEKRN